MSKVSEYGFTNAKLRARIGDIRSSSLVEDLIHAPTLSEAIAKLDGTRYQSLAEVYRSTGDLQQVELVLLEDEIKLYADAMKHMPRAAGEYVGVLLEKVEIDNLKSAVRLWYASTLRHHQIKYRSAYVSHKRIVHDIDYDRIMNASVWQEVVSGVAGTPYEAVFSSYNELSLSDNGLFQLEIALDHLWFSRVNHALSKLKGEDRIIASQVNSVDVDLKNILMLVRFRYYHHLDAKAIKSVIIPYGYIAEELDRTRALEAEDPVSLMRDIMERRYPKIADEIRRIRSGSDDLTAKEENGTQILQIEAYLSKTRAEEYRKLLRSHPFSIGVSLSYFYISRQEAALISAVLSAKYYKWDEGNLREALGL